MIFNYGVILQEHVFLLGRDPIIFTLRAPIISTLCFFDVITMHNSNEFKLKN